MHLHAAQPQMLQLRRPRVNAFDEVKRNAEFVLVRARGDFGVGIHRHVGIHAHGHRRDGFASGRDPVDAFQFRFALRVEAIHLLPQGKFNFRRGFSRPSENAFPRIAPRLDHAVQFALAHDVESAAQIRQRPQNGLVGIGFHGIANQVIHRRHGAAQLLEMVHQRAVGIHIERRAETLRERFKPDRFAIQPIAPVMELVHRTARVGVRGPSSRPGFSVA